jgi:hypothetical protein
MSVTFWRKAARRIVLACLLLPIFVEASVASATEQSTHRVLFVGNSLTYTNSLPAIFELAAHAQPGSPNYSADMFVRGGATLRELEQNEQLHDLLTSATYDLVILQERGGDDLCLQAERNPSFAGDDCEKLIAAHKDLAALAQQHGATVLYLGTYQTWSKVSPLLVDAERSLSQQMGAAYVEISNSMLQLRKLDPDLPWLYADNNHPGIATTTLMALRILQTLHHGQTPAPFDLCTASGLYTTKLKGHNFVTHEELTAPDEPKRCLLSETQMRTITDYLATPT